MLKKFIEQLQFYYFYKKPDVKELKNVLAKYKQLEQTLNKQQQNLLAELDEEYNNWVFAEMNESAWFGFCVGQVFSGKEICSTEIKNVFNELLNNLSGYN